MAEETGEYGEKKPVPVFFVMNRYKLGKTCLRKVPVACIAILNYQGSDDNFRAMSEMLPKLKEDYQYKLNEAILKINQQNPTHLESQKEEIVIIASDTTGYANKNLSSNATDDQVEDEVAQKQSINEHMLKIIRNK